MTARPARRLPLPYLLLLPSAVFMALLFGWPLTAGLREAFTGPGGFTMANWERVAGEPRFWEAVRNTLRSVIYLRALRQPDPGRGT